MSLNTYQNQSKHIHIGKYLIYYKGISSRREGCRMDYITTEKWSSLEEIAEHLGVSKDTIYRWIASKKMPAHKVGKLWKFKISEVDEWVIKGEAADE
jgi:excisionase family DNA binding protein